MKIFLLFLLFLLNTKIYANNENEMHGTYCLYLNNDVDQDGEILRAKRLIVVKKLNSNKCDILTTRTVKDHRDGSFYRFNNFDLLKLQINTRYKNGENKTVISTLDEGAGNPSKFISTVINSTNADIINHQFIFTLRILNPSFGNSFVITYDEDEDGNKLTRQYHFYKQISLEESNNLGNFMF